MRALLILALIAFTMCVEETKDEEFPIENDVTVLTDATFDKALEKYEFMMVLFYAPWCGHCKKFKPEYEKAAPKLRKDNVICAKVDATAEKNLASKFKIRGYPTIKFFIKGEALDYTGGRTESEVINWIKKKTQPPTKPLNTEEEVEKFIKDNEVCSLYFGENSEDMNEFIKIARKVEDFPFATVSDEKIATKYEVKPRTVVLFKNFDEKKNVITTIKEQDLEAFYKKYSLPKVLKIGEKSLNAVFGDKLTALFLFCSEKSPKWEEYDKLMHDIWEKMTEKNIKIFLTDVPDAQAKRFTDYLGAKTENFPMVMLVDPKERAVKKYLMEGEINKENILKFVDNWKDGKLTRFLKSQDEPKENNGDVKVIVAKTFQKEVIDNDNDVMMLFYAPWCGHCKHFHPTYEDVAKKLKEKNPKLVLGKMDATENEVESVQISGFPTIKFYPAGKKTSPLSYNGDRSFDDVVKFIKTNAKNTVVYEEEKKEEKKDDKKTSDL